jgi:hypothetical protein
MMDEFLSDLSYASIPDEHYRWQLLEPVRFRSARIGQVIVVPGGFECDLTSIPRPLWGFFPPMGPYAAAAVVHDYLYSIRWPDRRTADQIFLDAMASLGVPWWQRQLFYASSRISGGHAWRT